YHAHCLVTQSTEAAMLITHSGFEAHQRGLAYVDEAVLDLHCFERLLREKQQIPVALESHEWSSVTSHRLRRFPAAMATHHHAAGEVISLPEHGSNRFLTNDEAFRQVHQQTTTARLSHAALCWKQHQRRFSQVLSGGRAGVWHGGGWRQGKGRQ